MKIHTIIEVSNNRWSAQIGLFDSDPLTALEEEKIAHAGMPLVDVGSRFNGSITRPGDVDPTALDFTLPASLVRLPADFPVKKVFDLEDDPDADLMAKFWAQTVSTRMAAARDTVLTLNAAVSGETLETV